MARLTQAIKITADGRAAVSTFGEVKQASQDAEDSADGLSSSLGAAGEAAGDLPGPLGDAATVMSGPGGLAAGALLLGGAMFKAADAAADTAIEVNTIAEVTQSSLDESSRLLAVFEDWGVEANDIQDIILQTVGALEDNVELAKALGVDMESGASGAELFLQAVEGFDQLEGPERLVAGSKLFGEEGTRQVGRVTSAVGDLRREMEQVSDSRVVDEADVDNAIGLKTEINDMQNAWEGIAQTVGEEVMPKFTEMIGLVADLAEGLDYLVDSPLGRAAAILDEWVNPLSLAGKAIDGIVTQFEYFGPELDRSIDLTYDLKEAAGEIPPELEESQEQLEINTQATDAWKTSIEQVKGKYEELSAEIAGEQAIADLQDSFADLETAMVESYTAGATGSEDLEEKQRAQEQAVRDTKNEVIEVGTEMGLLPRDIETILTLIDNGTIADNQAALNLMERTYYANLQIRRIYVEGEGGTPYGRFVPSDRSAETSTTNVTVNMAAQPSARELSRMVASWQKNG